MSEIRIRLYIHGGIAIKESFFHLASTHSTVEHCYNKPEIPCQTVCYKQKFVISEQFPMRFCSTWLRSLLCYRGVCYKSVPL